MKRQLRAIAFHEAGHAFAAWHFRHRVKKATIIPNAKLNSLGHVESRPGMHIRNLEYTKPSGARMGRLHERIIWLMAGHAAQRKSDPGSVRRAHASSDNDTAIHILRSFHPETNKELSYVWQYLKAKTRNLIEHPIHWRVIHHLASELLKHKTMTGPEIESAILEGYQKDYEAVVKTRRRRRCT